MTQMSTGLGAGQGPSPTGPPVRGTGYSALDAAVPGAASSHSFVPFADGTPSPVLRFHLSPGVFGAGVDQAVEALRRRGRDDRR